MKKLFGEYTLAYLVLIVAGALFIYLDADTTKEALTNVGIFAGAFIIISLLISLVKKKKKPDSEYPLPEMDERVEKLSLKFMAQIFGLSHLIAAVVLAILYFNNHSTIPVHYVLYYVVGVLFFTMLFGLNIVKKL